MKRRGRPPNFVKLNPRERLKVFLESDSDTFFCSRAEAQWLLQELDKGHDGTVSAERHRKVLEGIHDRIGNLLGAANG